MPTHTQIKKLVGKGRLSVCEHDGEMFATNSYWLVPVENVRPLLEQFNLPTDKPAVYEIGSRITNNGMDAPNVASILPTKPADLTEIKRCELGGNPAFISTSLGYAAMFDHDSTLQAFNAEYLSFIDFDGALSLAACGYGLRLCPPIYRQAGPGKPLVVTAKREKQEGGKNDENGHYIKATWHDDGEQFLGLLMPIRI